MLTTRPPKPSWCTVHTSEGEIMLTSTVYRTPLIRFNWDGEPFGYADFPDNIFPFEKSAKIGSFRSIRYYLQYVPASKPSDHA